MLSGDSALSLRGGQNQRAPMSPTMCMMSLPARTRTLTVNTSGTRYFAMTRWVPALSVNEVKTLMELQGRSAAFEVTVAIQTATTDTSDPNSWSDLGSFLSSNAKQCSGKLTVGTTVDSHFFVRFGVGVKSTSGDDTLQQGQVTLAVTART
jgi:hypothetical protein